MGDQLFDPGPERVVEVPVTDDRLYDAVTEYLAASRTVKEAVSQRAHVRRSGNTARAGLSANHAFAQLVKTWQTIHRERSIRG